MGGSPWKNYCVGGELGRLEQLATQHFGRYFLNTETLGDNIYYTKLISVCFLRVDTNMEPAAALLNPFSHGRMCQVSR